jgi:ribosomal protein S18 acetylase RimI-like enzyme
MNEILANVRKQPEIKEVYLHVWTANEDALRFYETKFGFVRGEKMESYYRRIDPPDAYVLTLKVNTD